MEKQQNDILSMGLSDEEVREHIARGEVNVSNEKNGKSYGEIIFTNLFTFFNLVWAIITVILCCIGEFKNLTFLPVIIPNILIAIVLECHAKATVEKLSVTTDPRVRVVRGGEVREIMASEIVLGDLMLVASGQQILSDGVVVSGVAEANEAMLTGEQDAIRKETGAKVLVYRFPNLFGKWCRPNYNSAVATFSNAFANDLPYTVNDPSVSLELLYIDDLVDEMFLALEGCPHRCEFDGIDTVLQDGGKYCAAPVTHKVTLGEIVSLLESFKAQSSTLVMPEIPAGSFAKKLYSTYLSYLPKEKAAFPLKMNVDARGSFTELLRTEKCGQFSVNISKPGITKGQHWHNTKWEFFIVVSGKGLIQQRKVGTDEVLNFEVSGDKIEAVHMLPGYTHNIINLSDTENLVTVMWANEQFDPAKPDTFFEVV